MGKLSQKEKAELLRFAASDSFKKDFKTIADQRHNPVLRDGCVDMDRLITYLTEYNAFINHTPKPFKPIIDKIMKL